MKEIIQANDRIKNLINQTPLIKSTLLNQWTGHEVYFKAECLQKIGAFKARGASNAISCLINNKKYPKQIIANSSGNHAQAIAWAASKFGIPSKIFMPSYSSTVKIQATKSYGAEVELCESRTIADGKVKEQSNEKGVFWIPPFNNQDVIYGQGTAAFEILNKLDNVDAIFAPCGGGGLLSGSILATHSLSPKTKIYGAEPLNANDAAQSLRSNSIQRLTTIPKTIADGAMTMAIGDITFEYLKKLDGMYEIKESNIIYWTQWLSHLLKLHIEPTSALGMDAGIQWLKSQKSKKRIVIIITGGNIDQETQLKIWEKNFLNLQP